jgi:hypothetical protein
MADIGGSANDAFGEGLDYAQVPGRANTASITLGGGLEADSDRWNADAQQVAVTPHSVLAPYAFSRNASANGTDGSHFMPGYGFTGSANAMSGESFDQDFMLRMAGGGGAE